MSFLKENIYLSNRLVSITYFFDTFETNEFAFNKFKVLTKEMEEGEIIYAISYDGNSYEISDIEGDVQDEFIRLVAA